MARLPWFTWICVSVLLGCGDDGDNPDRATGDGDERPGDGDSAGDGDGADTCQLPFDPGPCEAAMPVFWYDVSTARCEERSYGGCGGNDNRFDSQAACEAACIDLAAVECETDADCGWGEIDVEITSPSDCVCLYGCPYIPLNRATIQRRQTQHDTHCQARLDGEGNPCGIDDCASPPTALCVEGRCTGDRSEG